MSPTPDSTSDDPQQIIADLQRERDEALERLAERTAERDEALEQQTATVEVLQVINSSPGDLAPVFDAMLEKAMDLCEAAFGGLFVLEGEQFRAVATRGLPRSLNDFVRRGFTADKSNPLLRGAMIDHIADLSERPLALRSSSVGRVRC